MPMPPIRPDRNLETPPTSTPHVIPVATPYLEQRARAHTDQIAGPGSVVLGGRCRCAASGPPGPITARCGCRSIATQLGVGGVGIVRQPDRRVDARTVRFLMVPVDRSCEGRPAQVRLGTGAVGVAPAAHALGSHVWRFDVVGEGAAMPATVGVEVAVGPDSPQALSAQRGVLLRSRRRRTGRGIDQRLSSTEPLAAVTSRRSP
jgi:hypothetical protein